MPAGPGLAAAGSSPLGGGLGGQVRIPARPSRPRPLPRHRAREAREPPAGLSCPTLQGGWWALGTGGPHLLVQPGIKKPSMQTRPPAPLPQHLPVHTAWLEIHGGRGSLGSEAPPRSHPAGPLQPAPSGKWPLQNGTCMEGGNGARDRARAPPSPSPLSCGTPWASSPGFSKEPGVWSLAPPTCLPKRRRLTQESPLGWPKAGRGPCWPPRHPASSIFHLQTGCHQDGPDAGVALTAWARPYLAVHPGHPPWFQGPTSGPLSGLLPTAPSLRGSVPSLCLCSQCPCLACLKDPTSFQPPCQAPLHCLLATPSTSSPQASSASSPLHPAQNQHAHHSHHCSVLNL